jgi:hypothetical protein
VLERIREPIPIGPGVRVVGHLVCVVRTDVRLGHRLVVMINHSGNRWDEWDEWD